jgi:hypothetical protein
MDPKPIILMAAVALAAAFVLLLAGGLAIRPGGPLAGRLRRAVTPLALAAAFVAGYVTQFSFPHAKGDRPWYADEAWTTAVVVVLLAGPLIALARTLPKAAALAVLAALAAGATFLTVRGPWLVPAERVWDGWPLFTASLAAALVLYVLAALPAGVDRGLWLAGPLVLWICTAAAAVVTLGWVDQRLGKMLIILAVLAGAAGVSGLWPRLRDLPTGAGVTLAVIFAPIMTLVAFYNEGFDGPILPRAALLLLAAAPLALAVAWVPALRRRPVAGTLAAAGLALAAVLPGVVLALRNAPALE